MSRRIEPTGHGSADACYPRPCGARGMTGSSRRGMAAPMRRLPPACNPGQYSAGLRRDRAQGGAWQGTGRSWHAAGLGEARMRHAWHSTAYSWAALEGRPVPRQGERGRHPSASRAGQGRPNIAALPPPGPPHMPPPCAVPSALRPERPAREATGWTKRDGCGASDLPAAGRGAVLEGQRRRHRAHWTTRSTSGHRHLTVDMREHLGRAWRLRPRPMAPAAA